MPRTLHVLIAEDNPLDAELVVRELLKSGYEPAWTRVDTREEFARQLSDAPPDIIISDHAMPQFSSTEALHCVQATGLRIPFIVVSHAIGEEEAVSLMRSGAVDYLMKDRLGRLGEAVRHALEAQQLREAHAASQEALVALNTDLEKRIGERTAELQEINRRLETELDSRTRAEAALQHLNAELERRVETRTRDLVAAHHRLRALASELTLAEQRERKRLAGELHDYLAQMLALGRMKIAQLRPKLEPAPAAAPMVREIDDLFTKALTYTRSLMAKLSPPVLDELGLPAALTWLAEQMPLHGLTVEVRLSQDQMSLPDDQGVLLFQSVRELLINVAKHAGTDRATVTLGVDEDKRLRIEVEDTGCGFDVTALDNKSAGEHFGLFSVRERMQAMGGWLAMKSTVGAGSTMALVLPLSEDTGPASQGVIPASLEVRAPSVHALPPLGADEGPVNGSLIRILLADDHVLVRQGLKALLEGYSNITVVGEAGDGNEAVAMAAMLKPQVVLMDINMPWMDGIEATKRIKKERSDVNVIALSVNNSNQVMEAMKQAGAASFVSKEAAADQLYDAVAAVMGINVSNR